METSKADFYMPSTMLLAEALKSTQPNNNMDQLNENITVEDYKAAITAGNQDLANIILAARAERRKALVEELDHANKTFQRTKAIISAWENGVVSTQCLLENIGLNYNEVIERIRQEEATTQAALEACDRKDFPALCIAFGIEYPEGN